MPVDSVDQSKGPARFTRVANLLELCALALPNGFDADGLPTDWHARIPPAASRG
jgi:aspartyl-tRNA(Asn)/glutamyl-tRNA(Gln) amidotransferase subunit A